MPRTALALVVLWFLSLFAFRTALQWWRTGSTGIRGFSGRVGSVDWSAGLLASLGMLGSVLTPVATLYGWPGGGLWLTDPTLHGVGIGVASLGIAGALLAQMSLGASWRIGVDEGETTDLVTRGLFEVVRNPIFSFMILSGLGLLAVLPTAFCAVSVALTCAGIELQVRAVEEPYLERTHGEAYRRYAAAVGRFVPGVGLLEPAERGSGLPRGAGSVG